MTLRYPHKTLYDADTDYMSFEFYKYVPPFSKDITSDQSAINEAQYYTTSGNQSATKDEDLNTVFLYMPEDVEVKYAASWGDKSFTNIQRDALRVAGAAAAVKPGAAITAMVDGARNMTGRVDFVIAQGIVSTLNNLPGNIGGSNDINQVLSSTTGTVLNPNVELLFEGFGLRNFSHTWKFAPQNEDEAREVKRIINTFKQASLPRYGTDAGVFENLKKNLLDNRSGGGQQQSDINREQTNANYIGVPDLVDVQYKKGSKLHPYLPKWKYCVISNVDVSYTPDGSFATYKSGSPVATQLTVGFQETKLVYRNDITDNENATY